MSKNFYTSKKPKTNPDLLVIYSNVIFIEQVIFNSVAYDAGVKNRDFVVEVNGTKVFDFTQDEFKELIKNAGDELHLKIER